MSYSATVLSVAVQSPPAIHQISASSTDDDHSILVSASGYHDALVRALEDVERNVAARSRLSRAGSRD